MKKVMNKSEHIIEEVVDGFLAAYGKDFEKLDNFKGVVRKELKEKVGIVIGGGTGHEPMFLGFIGEGLADGAALGNVFAAPTPNTVLDVTKAVDKGKGVLYIYGNYSGDILNFDMGSELSEIEGIETKTIMVNDDAASAPPERMEDRRGISGDVFVIKIAGAAAEDGLSLEETARIAQKANDHTRSIGIALSPATIPGLSQPTFTLGENEIEFGMGIHGEPGIERTAMMSADDMVDKMLDTLLADMPLNKGDDVCMLINGLGSTSLLELMIVNKRVHAVLKEQGVVIYDTDINSYCTSMEMGGFSITIMKADEELKRYYDQPASSPYYKK